MSERRFLEIKRPELKGTVGGGGLAEISHPENKETAKKRAELTIKKIKLRVILNATYNDSQLTICHSVNFSIRIYTHS